MWKVSPSVTSSTRAGRVVPAPASITSRFVLHPATTDDAVANIRQLRRTRRRSVRARGLSITTGRAAVPSRYLAHRPTVPRRRHRQRLSLAELGHQGLDLVADELLPLEEGIPPSLHRRSFPLQELEH